MTCKDKTKETKVNGTEIRDGWIKKNKNDAASGDNNFGFGMRK